MEESVILSVKLQQTRFCFVMALVLNHPVAATLQSIQHQFAQIPRQYRISHIIEHHLNVFRVDRGREMMIQRFRWIPFHPREHRQYEHLDIVYRMRIARELRKIPTYIGFGVRHFPLQQIEFV